MNNKRILFSTLIAITLLVVASCASDKKYIQNQEFEIPLEKHGQGGFQWSYQPIDGIIVVDSFETNKENESGFSEYTKHYKLKAKKRGNYTLKFIKIRSFEPDMILDENIKEIKVKIKKQ